MIIEKSISLPAKIEKVWQKIEDLEGIIKCMPGVGDVEDLGGNKWHIVIKQKVGFISATFDAKMEVTNWLPPTHLETATDATAKMGLGKVFQNQSLDLVAVSANETLAKYRAEVILSGKIGTFGQRILGSKVDQLSNDFAKSFIDKLTG
ncbi:CoxG family protein [Chloroflexota bacterium]